MRYLPLTPDDRAAMQDGMRDCLHQVRLADSCCAVDEERIEVATRRFGNRERRRSRELVGFSDDEVVERVLRVEQGPRRVRSTVR